MKQLSAEGFSEASVEERKCCALDNQTVREQEALAYRGGIEPTSGGCWTVPRFHQENAVGLAAWYRALFTEADGVIARSSF